MDEFSETTKTKLSNDLLLESGELSSAPRWHTDGHQSNNFTWPSLAVFFMTYCFHIYSLQSSQKRLLVIGTETNWKHNARLLHERTVHLQGYSIFIHLQKQQSTLFKKLSSHDKCSASWPNCNVLWRKTVVSWLKMPRLNEENDLTISTTGWSRADYAVEKSNKSMKYCKSKITLL
jgi:hypothetical protein